jgi:hypothetical protein
MFDSNGTGIAGCLHIDTAGQVVVACPARPVHPVAMTGGCGKPLVLSSADPLRNGLDVALIASGPVPAEVEGTLKPASSRPSLDRAVRRVAGALPFTGMNTLTFVLTALLLIAVGGVLLRTGRRRTRV